MSGSSVPADRRWVFAPLCLILGYCTAVIGYLVLVTTRNSDADSCGRLLVPNFGRYACTQPLTDRYAFAGVHVAVALGVAAVAAGASLSPRRRTGALRVLAAAAGAGALLAALGVAFTPIHPTEDSTCGTALQPENSQGPGRGFCHDKVTTLRWGVAGLLAGSAGTGAVAVRLGRLRRAVQV